MNPNRKKGIVLIIFVCGTAIFGALQAGLIPFHGPEVGYLSHTFSLDWQDITKIEITYTDEHENALVYRFHKIEAIDGIYYSNTGEKVDPDAIQFLAESFTDFYESHDEPLDDHFLYSSYPHIVVVVTLTNEDPIILESDSDYHCFIPWDITYDGTSYLQYNGKIPSALLRILIELDRELWSLYDKESRWGCYLVVVPEEYAEQGCSNRFTKTEPQITPAEAEGKKHILWQVNLQEVGALDYGNGRVFVSLSDRVISLDAETGAILWEVVFTQKGSSLCDAKSVVVHDGVVYIGAPDSWVYSIDGETGAVLWKYKTNASTYFQLTISGDTLAALTGGITLLEKETGTLLLEITDDTWNEVFYQDKILFAGFEEDSKSYYALLDIESGKIVWKENFFNIQQPVYHEGVLYYSRPEVTAFFSYDVNTAEEMLLYTHDEPLERVKAFEDLILLVVPDDGLQELVFVEPTESKMRKLTFPEKITSDADLVIYQGTLFVARKGGIIKAFNLENGELAWENEVRGTEIISFTVYENSIYVSANDGNIYCLEPETGEILWMAATNVIGVDAFVYICAIGDGFLFVITGEGDLYAFSV